MMMSNGNNADIRCHCSIVKADKIVIEELSYGVAMSVSVNGKYNTVVLLKKDAKELADALLSQLEKGNE